MTWTEEWDAIVDTVPPHCGGIVAELARQFSELWADMATRAAESMAKTG